MIAVPNPGEPPPPPITVAFQFPNNTSADAALDAMASYAFAQVDQLEIPVAERIALKYVASLFLETTRAANAAHAAPQAGEAATAPGVPVVAEACTVAFIRNLRIPADAVPLLEREADHLFGSLRQAIAVHVQGGEPAGDTASPTAHGGT
jgi:hypothetical protein